jgi:PAS domain S-box-containing protein
MVVDQACIRRWTGEMMERDEKIMVLSEDRGTTDYLTELLTAEGYQVISAGPHDEAVSLTTTPLPDLILTDAAFQDGNDASLTSYFDPIAGLGDDPGIPILLLLRNHDEPGLMIRPGIVDIIRTPFHSAELLTRVRVWMDLRKLRARISDQTAEMERIKSLLEQERSRRLQAEGLQKQAEEFYLKVLDDFPNPVWRADVTAKCNYFNRFWLEFTGRTMEEEMGDGWAEGVHPDDFQRCLSIYLDNFHRHTPFVMEYRLRYHDGSYHWLLDCGNPFYSSAGEFAGYIGSCYDIQDRKNAEALLHDANAELQERIHDLTESRHEVMQTKEYLEKLIAYASAPILVWDSAYQITRVNEAFAELTGIRAREAIGRSISQFFPGNLLENLLHNPPERDPAGQWKGVEIPVIRPSGETRIVVWNVAYIRGADGELEATIVQGHDITEHIQAEKALAQLNRQLNLMSSITRHDILNQVNVMEFLVNFLKSESTGVSAERLADMETVAASIKAQIEFTRMYQQLGSQAPQWQHVIKIASPDHLPEGVRFQIHGTGIEVYADLLLRRVFDNLLDNSIRHGGTVTRIDLSFRQSSSGLVIIWEDDGVGVPADEKEAIFDRGHGKNTGLGLFLIREILLITGMTISETGVEGEGARFEIQVPDGGWRVSPVQSREPVTDGALEP